MKSLKVESPAVEIRGWKPQIGLPILKAVVQFELYNLESPMQDFPFSISFLPHIALRP